MDKELETSRHQLDSNPHDVGALARLESALLKTGDFAGLAALYADRLANASPDEQRQGWHHLVAVLDEHSASADDQRLESEVSFLTGRIVEDHLGHADQAMVRYQRAFKLDAHRVDALRAARSIYVSQGNWRLVLQIFSLELQTTQEPLEQAELYFQMADICVGELGERGDAALCARTALQLAPDHERAVEFTALLQEVHSDLASRFAELVAQAEQTRDPRQRAALQLEAAELWMKEQPDDPQTEGLLHSVLAVDSRNDHARILLEQYYESNADWTSLTRFLEGRIEQTTRKADRVAIFHRLAQIAATERQDAALAARWFREVLTLDPNDEEALSYAVDYFGEAEQWADLVAIYEAALRARGRGHHESAMLVQIAMILWRKVGDLEQAETYFKRIKLNDPRNGLMLQFYTEFYATQQDWKKLLATLASRQSAEASVEVRIELGLEMARVAEAQIDNAEKAIDIWKSILKLKNDHPAAREALRRLFLQTQKWNALLEFLKEDLNLIHGVAASDITERVSIYRRMIEIYRDQLNLEVMVVNTYNQILLVDSGNAEALDALQARYEVSARWNDLIGILKKRIDLSVAGHDDDGLVGLHRHIAQLWIEKFSNPVQAIGHLEAILELRPREEATIGQLIDIYRHRKDWRALYAIYHRQLDLLVGAARIDRLKEMARIAAERLEERGDAIELWRAVVEAEPEDSKAWQSLEQLLQKTERHAELAQLYADQARRAPDDSSRIAWLKKLGNVYAEKLDDEERAAETWRAVLRITPGDAHAENYLRELNLRLGDWDALEALYGDRSDWEGLIRLLSGSAAQGQDVGTRVDLYRRMARICHINLANEAAAVECWERVLHEDPENAQAARVLAPHFARVAKWDRLVAVLGVQLRSENEDQVALHLELSTIHERSLGDVSQAFSHIASGLQLAPERPDILVNARRLALEAGLGAELVVLLASLCDVVDDAPTEVRLRSVLGEVCRDELGRGTEAAVHFERVRTLAGDAPELLAALVALYEKLSRWDDLLVVMGRQLDHVTGDAEQARILLAMATLHETVRDDAGSAEATFAQLHALDPRNLEALYGLQRLAERRDDPESLIGYLEQELELTTEPTEVASLWFRLGQLDERRDHLGAAVERFAHALDQVPEHLATVTALERFLDGPVAPRAAEILEPHMRVAQKWSSLRRVLEIQVGGSDQRDFRTRVLREVATLQEHELADLRGAFGTWKRLLFEDRNDGSVRDHLERLANELASWDAVAQLYQRFSLGGLDPGEDRSTATLYSRRLAVLLEDRLGDFAEARSVLDEVLSQTGEELDVLNAVDRLTTRLSDWPGLVEICERKLDLLESVEERVAVLYRIGDLHEEVLEDAARAIDAYRRIRSETPADARALDALERLYRLESRFVELVDLLSQRAEDSAGDARIALCFQLAVLNERQLLDFDEALGRYAQVVAMAPDHEPTLDALETFLAAHPEANARLWRIQTCDILEPVYVSNGNASSEAEILEARLRDAEDLGVRIALHTRLSRLAERRLDDAARAFRHLSAALSESFGEPSILPDLYRLAEHLGAWSALGDVLGEGLDGDVGHSLTPDLRREMLRRVSQVQDEKVGDLTLAIGYNRRILEEWPDDREALEVQSSLFERVGDVESLIEVIERRIDLSADAVERQSLCFQLASLFESLPGSGERAIATYAQIRAFAEPSELRAHRALERLYDASGQWAELVAVLTDHAELCDDASEKRSILLSAATVSERNLNRLDDAVSFYRAVLSFDGDDRETLGQLDRLYTHLERELDLLEILEIQLRLADDPDEQSEFECRLGRLLIEQLGEVGRAVSAFRAVVTRTPDHKATRAALERLLVLPEARLDAARILIPLYESDGQWARLRDLLNGTLVDLDDIADRIETLGRVSKLEEDKLNDPHAALLSLAEAWRQSEGDVCHEPELWRLASLTNTWEALVELYGEGLLLAPARALELRLRRASILDEQVQAPERAIVELREALNLEPDHHAALTRIEALYGRTGDAASQAEMIDRRIALATEKTEKVTLLFRLAELSERALLSPSDAIETCRRVLLLDEREPRAMDELDRLLSQGERWAELAELFEHRMSTVSGRAERAEFEFGLAELWRTHLGDGARALSLYAAILADLPKHAGTRLTVSSLFEDPIQAADAGIDRRALLDLLEPLLRSENAFAALSALLDARQAELTDDPHTRFLLLRELSDLQEHRLSQTVEAFGTCVIVLDLAPEHEENRADLRRLGQGIDMLEAVSTHLQRAAHDTTDLELQVSILMELGAFEEGIRGDNLAARAIYLEVQGKVPDHRRAITALVDLFSRTAAWNDLVALYLRLADDTADLDERKGLFLKVCHLLTDVLDDAERASDTWRKVLELEPDSPQAFRALERHYSTTGQYESLAGLLQDEIRSAPTAASRADLLHRLGETFDLRLDARDRAIEAWRAALQDEVVDHEPSLASLERVLLELAGGDPRHPSRQRTAEVLEPIYAARGQHLQWVATMEVQLDFEADRWRRVELQGRIARAYEDKIGAHAAAFTAWSRAFAEDYGNTDMQAELDRLAAKLGNWSSLIDVYLQGIEQYDDLDGAQQILIKIASAYDTKLEDVDRAIDCYRRVLLMDDAHAESLSALERLYAGERRFEDLVVVLARKADLARDILEKKEHLYRTCEIWEEVLDRPDQAIEAYQRILEEDPEDHNAIEALIRLYERTGSAALLVEILREKLEMASSEQESKEILFRIARVCEEQLGDAEETVLTYRTVLESDPRDRRAMEALDRLYSRDGRWGELVDLLETERGIVATEAAEMESPGSTRLDALDLRIGDVLEHHRGETERAIEIYGEILERSPEAVDARWALGRLLESERFRLSASRALEPHFKRTRDADGLARIYELQLLDVDDRVERLDLFKQLARLQGEVQGQRRQAFESYLRAFQVDPADEEIVSALHTLADELQAYDTLAGTYEEQVGAALDGEVARGLNRRLAKLCEERLGRPDRAVEAWQSVLRADPYDTEALASLDRLYQGAQEWELLIDVLRQRIDLDGHDAGADLRFRLAYLLEVVRGDMEPAIDLYRSILWEKPDHAYALEAMERLAVHLEHRAAISEVLEPLYRDAGLWEKLAILTEMRVELADRATDQATLWAMTAELRETRLQDADGALECLMRAFACSPSDEDVRTALLRVGAERGAWARLADAFDAAHLTVDDDQLRLADLLRVADWSRGRLRDVNRASERYAGALVLDPDNERALDALEEIFESLERWGELAEIQRRKIDLTFELDQKKVGLFALGALLSARLRDTPRAVAAYEEILGIDETEGRALDALEALHTGSKNAPALVDVLNRRAESTYDAVELSTLYRRIAALQRDELSDRGAAAESLERVLQHAPEDASAIDALISLYTDLGEWDRLQDVLVKSLAQASGPAEEERLLLALGENAEARLDRADAAIEYYRQILVTSSANEAAFTRLAPLYERAEQWFELAELHKTFIPIIRELRGQSSVVGLLVQLASLAEDKLADSDLAIASLNEVLDASPHHLGALNVLARLYERAGEWERCATTLSRAIENGAPGKERAEALRRLGLLYMDRLGQPADAISALRRAVDEADDQPAVDALLRLAEARNDEVEVATWLEHQLQRTQGSARVPVLLRLADLRGRASDTEGRVAALEQANLESPDDSKVADALISAYFTADAFDKAGPMLQRIVERLKAERRFKELFGYNFQLGRVAEEQGQDEAALVHYTECFDYDATFIPNLFRLARLHFRRENWEKSLKIFQTMLLHQNNIESNEQRVDIFYHLGVLRLKGGDPRKAKDMFNRALGYDPEHASSKAALEGL